MFDPVVYVNVRDRVTVLRQLVEWLESAGHERIVLLDNNSTYEPLVEYLKATPHDLVCVGRNYGARALWDADVQPRGWFVYTDPDIVPIEECPYDLAHQLRMLLERHRGYDKAGPGLYLDDVPDTFAYKWHERGPRVRGVTVPEGGAYHSMIDTTFALHRPGARFCYPALRMAYPYEARHICPAWYGGELSEEDRYYVDRAITDGPAASTWACQELRARACS